MSVSLQKIQSVFFVGIAGFGMSALAQYMNLTGKKVSGSDRNFSFNLSMDIKSILESEGIHCHLQDASGIHSALDLIVVSSIVDQSIPQIVECKKLGLKIITRSELLALIVLTKKTISVGGTSGKSTTAAMIFHILSECKQNPSLISGAGLMSEIKKGRIGNCVVGKGQWLVIEADESDGSITKYKSEVGVLLNISKDHKQIEDLKPIFEQFKINSTYFVQNKNLFDHSSSHQRFQILYSNKLIKEKHAEQFTQNLFESSFRVDGTEFHLKLRGHHNLENALAAISACSLIIPCKQTISTSLSSFQSISRRCEHIGTKNGVTVIDDYAHNPVKCRAIIQSMKELSQKLIVWFQPHGFSPLKLMIEQFSDTFNNQLQENDEIWINEVYSAAGSNVAKTISSEDLVNKINQGGGRSHYTKERQEFVQRVKEGVTSGTIILLMGARDPTLSDFAQSVFRSI